MVPPGYRWVRAGCRQGVSCRDRTHQSYQTLLNPLCNVDPNRGRRSVCTSDATEMRPSGVCASAAAALMLPCASCNVSLELCLSRRLPSTTILIDHPLLLRTMFAGFTLRRLAVEGFELSPTHLAAMDPGACVAQNMYSVSFYHIHLSEDVCHATGGTAASRGD